MEIARFVNSIFASNSYVISEEGEAFLIDAGDPEPIAAFLRENNLALKGILLTHTHYDHIFGLPGLMRLFPEVKIYTSEFGKEALGNPKWNFSRYHGDEISIVGKNIVPLRNESDFRIFKNSEVRAIAVPGHDPGCLAFMIGDNLFTGDSYIPGLKVIASFPKSDREAALHYERMLGEMGVNHNIYPGHGEIFLRPTGYLKSDCNER